MIRVMKFLSKYLFIPFCGLLFLTALSACGNVDSIDGQSDSVDLLNIELTLMMPRTTRSSTVTDGGSSDNTVNGEIEENKLNTVNLYFAEVKDPSDASKDEIIYTLTNITDVEDSEESGSSDNYITKVIKKGIRPQEFSSFMAGKKIRLYVAANTELGFINSIYSQTLSFTDADQGYIGRFGNIGKALPLVNKKATDILDLSSKSEKDIEELLKEIAWKENNSWSLNSVTGTDIGGFGDIHLERAVARIDYKDASRSAGSGYPATDHVYPLGDTGIYLKVISFNPVNVSKSCYLYRHTAPGDNEKAEGNPFKLFGEENGQSDFSSQSPYDWIADTDWEEKLSSTSGIITGFLNVPSECITRDDISGFTGDKYRPWRYISENTPPSTDKMIQGLSTGVAFQVLLCKEDGTPLSESEILNQQYKDIKSGLGEDKSNPKPTLEYKGRNANPERLDGEVEGFYLTYYYWIRHNDFSHSVEITDPMEFAVVRNNVYRLSITGFNELPRPYDPSSPDEEVPSKLTDISVSVNISAWDYYSISMDI